MKRVRVLRDDIDKRMPNPILVETMRGGFVDFAVGATKVHMTDATMVYSPDAPLADGTRVWIEAVEVTVLERNRA